MTIDAPPQPRAAHTAVQPPQPRSPRGSTAHPATPRSASHTACAAAGEAAEPISRPIDQARAALPADLIADDEIIIMWLKPSPLYIILASLGSLVLIATLTLLLAYISALSLPKAAWSDTDAFLFGATIALIRLAWQGLEWWNQTYVLTDRRIIAIYGVLRRSYFHAPLQQIQHIAVVQTIRERAFGLGTLAFATAGSDGYDAAWLSLAHPFQVYRQVNNAIDRYGKRH